MDFFKTAWSWFTGSSMGPTLARLALLGYASRLLTKSLEQENEKPDKGVRLQLNPSTENFIPVVYGEAYLGGNIIDAQISADYKKMTYALVISEVTGTLLSSNAASAYTFEGVYFNGNSVVFKADGITVDYTLDPDGNQDISARDLIKVYFYKGQTGIKPYGISGTPPASYTVMPGWTLTTHPMTNLVYAIVEVTYNAKQNINGLPDCQWHIKNSMKKPGDVFYDYATSTRYGAGIAAGDIDSTSLSALTTFCNTGFSYTDTSNATVSSAIETNGVLDPSQNLLSNMSAIIDNTGNWLTYDVYTGKWTVILNKAGTSVVTLTDSNIIGEISISGTSLTQLDNQTKVQYQNTNIKDKTDFVKIAVPSGELHPNEPEKTREITLPFVNKQVVAAKIGLQQLKQARVDKIITFKTDFSYLQIKAGDIVGITSDVYGFTAKLFRVITAQETENSEGDLVIEFKALEYESTVYDYNITEYAVETNNGILGIGSIGKPNTPTITKQEIANIPSIVIVAEVPSGVVSEIEFWLTYDVSVGNDNARTYNIVGRYSNPDGSLLTEDDIIEQTCSGLANGNFIVKCRGINAFKSGPFSDPTGIINYVPNVTADSVDINAQLRNAGTALGILTVGQLLFKLDSLLGGDVTKSIMDGVLDVLFPDRVGNDTSVTDLLLSDTAYTSQFAGTINNLNNISIDELLDVDTTSTAPATGDSLVWDGSTWAPSSSVADSGGIKAWARFNIVDSSSVELSGSFGIDPGVEMVTGTTDIKITFATEQTGDGYVVVATRGSSSDTISGAKTINVYDQTTKSFKLKLESGVADDVVHMVVIGAGTAACLLTQTAKFPGDRADKENPMLNTTADRVEIENTISDENDNAISITYNTGTIYKLNKGSGNVKLYKSNGTLSQTLAASGVVIEGSKVILPFANRDYGTDYYILMDKGVVQGVDEDGITCYSPAITTPFKWNFHTVDKADATPARKTSDVKNGTSKTKPAPVSKRVPEKCVSLQYVGFETQSTVADSNNQKVDVESWIKIKFNNDIKFGSSGTITVRKSGIVDSTHQAINIAHTFAGNRTSELVWIDSSNKNTLVLNVTKDFDPGATYYVLITANCVYDSCGINGNKVISDTQLIRFRVDPGPAT
ncbi:Tip attachment protein J [uncultured Caudovirales phage]|uniref:Tip attachment protein J n=1 Tax=uncultured Caudovirales phage TaxID=2100421 RepID=A0A6J7XA57_9CAUD|nr:Tip attachment protein J [uncultured Caudovirales phage]